jgi:predicted MFS family arabinose efflux permease
MGTYLRRFPRAVWLLLFNTLGAFTGYGVVVLIYNLYLVALGYHEDFIGLFASANAVAMIVGSVGAIAISQRWGHGWCLVSASVGVVLSGLGLSFASDPATILFFGTVNGLALGQLFVPAGPFLIEHSSARDRQDAFSLIWASQSLSQALGSAVAGLLPAAFATALTLGAPTGVAPLRLTLLAGALLSAFGLVPGLELIRLRPGGDSTAPSRPAAAARTPVRSDRRLILTFAFVIFMTSVSTGFVWPFLNVYFADRLGATTAVVGAIFVAISVAMVVAQLAGPLVARRLGIVTGIWVARLATLPLMIGMAFVPSLLFAATAVTVRGALVAMSWPLDNAFSLGLVSPRNTARLSSARGIAFNAGQAVSSVIAGQIIIAFGYPPTFLISAACIFLASIVHYRSFRREDPHPGVRNRLPWAREGARGEV